jgi:hypothetical protein
METATRIYPAVGITIYKDTFYVYEDSNDIWYMIKQGYGRHNRDLFVKASTAHSGKILQYSGLNSINLNTSEDFREDVGTVLTPSSKDIHKYYEALYNIPTAGNVKFLSVYVDMLTVIQVSRLGKHYGSVDVYAVRAKDTRELVGYVAASVVNGAVHFKEGSRQRASYTSNLRRFIGKIRTGNICVFSMRGVWQPGDYVVVGSYYNSPEDSQDNVFAAWSDVFMDSAVAMTAKDEVYVNGPLKFISAPEDAILPERPGVIRWPDHYTLRKRKYVIHTTNVYKVGEHSGVFYKATDPRKGTTHFVNANPFCSAYISADVDVKNWITADGVAWTILTDDNCPEISKHRLNMHKKNLEKYKNYIVMSTCYVDISKKYTVQVPLNGNRKPSETMYAYRVHYFNSDEVSYVSEAVTTPNGNARSILYFLDTVKPGHVVSSCKNVHNTADVTIKSGENLYEIYEVPLVTVGSVSDMVDEKPQPSSIDDLTAKVTSVITFPDSIQFSVAGRRGIVSVDKTKLFRVLADDPDDNVYLGAYTLKGDMLGLVKETDALSGELCIHQTTYEQVTDPGDPKLSTEFKKAARAYARQYYFDSQSIYAGKATIHLSEYYEISSGGRFSTAHRVSFEDSSDYSFISTCAFCDDLGQTRYHVNLVASSTPGSYISSSHEVHAKDMYLCSFKCIEGCSRDDLSQWVRNADVDSVSVVPAPTSNAVVMEVPAEIVTAPEPVEVATADSVERLYSLIVPRLDALGVGQDKLTARVKKLETDLEQLATDEERRGLEIKTALDTLVKQHTELLCYAKDSNLIVQQLPKLQDQVKLYLDAINNLRNYVDGVHLSVRELILKQGETDEKIIDHISNTKGSVEAVRTAIQRIVDVFKTTLSAMDEEFAEAKNRQQSIEASVNTLMGASLDVVEYQERILQNQERKGFWNWLKSLFTK